EGVMPQTREHFAIARLLGVERGLVVLTKRDLVDDETAALAEAEVRELLAGSALEGAPIVAASASTGEGCRLAEVFTSTKNADWTCDLWTDVGASRGCGWKCRPSGAG
ncbi:MAG TPA: hypothetical protein DCE44_25695, partial [Verrucomicrobiales bacterium]|nr:hypothetical protein [Verrucomicrobiales bacterium]